MRKRTMLTSSALALCTLVSAGVVYASTTSQKTPTSQTPQRPGIIVINGEQFSLTRVLTTALGINSATLQSDLQKGKSIVQLAKSKGISEAILISDLESNLKSQLDRAVASGKVTAKQEETVLKHFDSNIKQILAGTRIIPGMSGAW